MSEHHGWVVWPAIGEDNRVEVTHPASNPQRLIKSFFSFSPSFDTFCNLLSCHQLSSITDFQKWGKEFWSGTRWQERNDGTVSENRTCESWHRTIFVIRWGSEEGSGGGGSGAKKPVLWVIFPSPSICSHLRLHHSELVTLLQQPPFDAVNKRMWLCSHACACLALWLSAWAAGHYSIQQIMCDTTLEGVMSPWRSSHQESPCWEI